MSLYLFDTDAIIDILNQIPLALKLLERLFAEEDTPCTCGVVVSEVYAGSAPGEVRPGRLLRSFEFLPTTFEAAEQAGRWRYEYARLGFQLGTPDLLIAATAIDNDAVLITANRRHFPMQALRILPLPR